MTKGSPDKAAMTCLLHAAKELFRVQCRACSGYGHTHKFCSTLPRVRTAIGPNMQLTKWLNSSLERHYVNMRGDVPASDNL